MLKNHVPEKVISNMKYHMALDPGVERFELHLRQANAKSNSWITYAETQGTEAVRTWHKKSR